METLLVGFSFKGDAKGAYTDNYTNGDKRLNAIKIELNRLLERLPLAKATLQDDYDKIINSYKV